MLRSGFTRSLPQLIAGIVLLVAYGPVSPPGTCVSA